MLLQSPRVAIRHLNLARTCNIFEEPTRSFQFFIQQVLRDDLSSLEELVFGEDGVALDMEFAVIFSALRYSTKLKTLRIQQHPGREFDGRYNTAALWSWLALAVVHPSSASQLQELALPHVQVTESIVETARNALSSAHPGFVTLMAQTSLTSDDDIQPASAGETYVVVKRRTKLRNWPKSSAWAIPLSKSAIDRPLEVVATLNDWICVIVPGYGFAWVRDSAVVARERRNVVQTRPNPLRSFMWEPPNSYELSDTPAIGALVQLLGQELRALHLPRTLITADVMRLILVELASLQHLEVLLHGVRSLDFLEKYARGSLQSLIVQFDASAEQQASVISPTTAVSNLTTFLASPPGHAVSGIAFECARADREQVEQLLA